MNSLGKIAVKILGDANSTNSITGIIILDSNASEINNIKEAMPDHDIIEDAPLSLIPPEKTARKFSQAQTQELDTWHLESIQLARARASGYLGQGKSIGVAILDTGVEEVEEIRGRVKSAFQYNSNTNSVVAVNTHDTEGHGTHVAGLIAGKNVGIAPQANLMNYVMIPGGNGNISDFINAIEFIAGRPEISIMNMSAGIPGFHPGMQSAIRTLRAVGVLPVVAIGNEGRNTSRSPGNYVDSFSVGASNKMDKVSNFSGSTTMTPNNLSYMVPDLVAPGEAITSCVMGGGYESWNGTSMATPIVSGIAALIIEKYPTISEIDLRGEIFDAIRFLPSIPPIRQGDGLLQFPSKVWYQGV